MEEYSAAVNVEFLVFTVFGLVILIIVLSRYLTKQAPDGAPERRVPIARAEDRPVAAAPRRAGRNLRQRMQAARARDDEEEAPFLAGDSDNDDIVGDDFQFDDKGQRVGAKKRKKLEMKAEKKAQREAEMEDREDRKKRQEEIEKRRKQKDEMEKAEEEAELEKQRLEKEEKECREYEEYLEMKKAFSIDESGFDETSPDETQSLLQDFVNHIKERKVVLLEDLASHFKLKTQEAIDRVTELQENGTLTGVIDDRGKFIYISRDELEAVAKFIKQRGRVSITELVESSNCLINLNPEC